MWLKPDRVGFLCLLLCFAFFCSQCSAQVCSSTRNNSTCEYYVCASLCDSMNFPEGALVYSSVSLALDAVTAESRGSEVNIIYLVAGDDYECVAQPLGILHLDIVSYMPPFAFVDPPLLLLTGNLVNISNSLNLVKISLFSGQNLGNVSCIEVVSPLTATISIVNSIIGCPMTISGQIDLKVTNHSRLSDVVVMYLQNGTVLLQDMTFYPQGKSVELERTPLIIKKCKMMDELSLNAFDQARIELYDSTFYDRASLDVRNVETRDAILIAERNFFNQSLQVQGIYWSVKAYHNTFLKYYDNYALTIQAGFAPKAYAHWEPSALFSATCDAHLELIGNTFVNGTLYFDIPYHASTSLFCPGIKNPYSTFKVNKNRFLQPPFLSSLRHNAYGAYYGNQGYSPAIAVMGTYSPFTPNEFKNPEYLDASYNWWGDASGPSLCCNPSGQGSFSAPWIDPSFWCLDPDCNEIDSINYIPLSCVLHGCPQTLSHVSVAMVGLFAVIGIISTLTVIIYAIILQRIHFTPEKIQYKDPEENLVLASKLFLLGLLGSNLGCISTCIVVAMWLSNNYKLALRPLQQVIFPQSMNVCFWIAILSGIQLIFNLIIIFLVFMRRKYPRLLKVSLRAFWLWCAISVCLLANIFIGWAPTLYHSNQPISTDTLRATGFYVWMLSSPLNEYVFLAFAMVLVALYAAMIPGRLLHNHVCHPEYVKISTTLETSMLGKVVKIARLDSIALGTRWVSVFALVMGLTQLGLQITVLAIPTIYYVGQDELRAAFTPVGLFRISFAVAMAFTMVGLGGLVATIWATRKIRPAGHYTVISLLVIVSVVGTSDMLIKSFSVFSIGSKVQARNITWAIINTVFSSFYFLSLLAVFFLLRSIRSSILSQLAKQARQDINAHLDNAWHQTNTINDYTTHHGIDASTYGSNSTKKPLRPYQTDETDSDDEGTDSPGRERIPLLSAEDEA